MIRRFFALALALCLIAAPLAAGAQLIRASYVPGTEDVPLMPGLHAIDAASLVFEKPQGRIIAAAATGAVTKHAVLAFYRESLPELGWSRANELSYMRDGERLSLEFGGRDGALSVGFMLAPH